MNTHNPFPCWSPELGALCPLHTYVHSLCLLEHHTWRRTSAPCFRRWHCQGSPEMACETGALPLHSWFHGSLFQKSISLLTLQVLFAITSLQPAFNLGYSMSSYLNRTKQTVFDTVSHRPSCSVLSVSALVGVYKVCGEAIEM